MVSRKVKIYGFLALLLVLAALPVWIFREPSYKGRSLSEWLAEASSTARNGKDGADGSSVSEASAAIRVIGPRAVSPFVRMLSAKEILLGEVQRSLRNEFVPREKQIPAPWELQRRGFAGLQILGPAAASAIPDILQLIEREPHRTDLWFLLERIGPSSAVAAPLLERSFPGLGKSSDPRWNDSDFHPAWLASDLMMSWGGSYREIVTKELNGKTNSLIKRVSCLWALRKDPEFARGLMPRMVKMISDQSESTTLKTAALHALGRIPKSDEN